MGFKFYPVIMAYHIAGCFSPYFMKNGQTFFSNSQPETWPSSK
jgi:hypothetical protein